MLYKFLNLLGAGIMTFGSIFSWSILKGKKLNFKSYKIWISIISLAFLSAFNYNSVLKFSIITVYAAILVKLNFSTTVKTGFITSIFTQIINALLEIIFSLIAIYVFKMDLAFKKFPILLILFADLFISLGCVFIVKFKVTRKIYDLLVRIINRVKSMYLLLCLFPIIFAFNAYLELTYYKVDKFLVFVLNNVSIYMVVIAFLILAKKEKEYMKIYDKYNNTLNSLKEYEDMLDKYRIFNHENKNQLLTIRNMLGTKNNKVVKYIDQVIENNLKDNEQIMQKVLIIPSGGLRGLIYSKVLYMEENDIQYKLSISNDITTLDLIKGIENNDIIDICQVVGVYIDNAIDAVLEISKKHISIEMYLDCDVLVLEVSNYYKGKIELDKLEQIGYTTKGNGRGYGLNLTKKIIDKNKKLQNQKKINKDIFTQVLKIKIK